MRYILSKDIRKRPALRHMLTGLALLLLIFTLAAFFQHYLKGYLDPVQLRGLIAGDPELFMEPMILVDLLETVHVNLFLYTFALLLVFSLYLHHPDREVKKQIWMIAAFAALILDNAGWFAVRYLDGGFVYVKIAADFALHFMMVLMLFKSLYFLGRKR